jgi:hypothetical protein
MIDPTLGLRLSLSAIEAEFKRLDYELRGTTDALEQGQSMVTMKICMDHIERQARWIANVASAESSRLSDHLNRHAVAAE